MKATVAQRGSSIFALILSACAAPPPQEDLAETYPEAWGALADTSNSISCPVITGRYHSRGIEWSALHRNSERTVRQGAAEAEAWVQWHPRLGSQGGPISAADPTAREIRPRTFEVRKQTRDRFEMIFLVSGEGAAERFVFEKPAGDFSCLGGWIVLRSRKVGGANEASISRGTDARAIARLADGSLLYKKRYTGTSTGALMFSTRIQKTNYYRFSPAE